MSLVGAGSVTVAVIFSLIALGMFFDTDAFIAFGVIASYLVLVLVIFGVVLTFIRWLQVLINAGKVGNTKWGHKNQRKFKIAFIVLGVLCVLLALFSSMGIFIFGKKLSEVSVKVRSAMNKEEAAPEEGTELAQEDDSSWYNETCAADPDGTACSLCGPCPNRDACDVCVEKARVCTACACDPEGEGRFCFYLRVEIPDKLLNKTKSDDTNSTGNSTAAENPLSAFLGEPAEDSRCYNIGNKGLQKVKRTFCQLYEITNSWHCDNETRIPDKIDCIAINVGKGATNRYIVAVLLLVCLVGHMGSLIVACCCSGGDQTSENGYEYSPQSDDNDDKDGAKEKEEKI